MSSLRDPRKPPYNVVADASISYLIENSIKELRQLNGQVSPGVLRAVISDLALAIVKVDG